jgi:hypothetical protein
LFAILGFCYVPLGAHTALEHTKAIFGTAAAKRAGVELWQAVARVRGKLSGEVEQLATGGATPTPPVLPAPHKAGERRPEHAHQPE